MIIQVFLFIISPVRDNSRNNLLQFTRLHSNILTALFDFYYETFHPFSVRFYKNPISSVRKTKLFSEKIEHRNYPSAGISTKRYKNIKWVRENQNHQIFRIMYYVTEFQQLKKAKWPCFSSMSITNRNDPVVRFRKQIIPVLSRRMALWGDQNLMHDVSTYRHILRNNPRTLSSVYS